jgi:hypothetical protein
MDKQEAVSPKSFIRADNPDDLEGSVQKNAQGDPETLVKQDNPDDVEIKSPS